MSAERPRAGRGLRGPRLAYLGTLAGGLAHEIKNPLSTLLINLGLLREDLAGSAESGVVRGRKRIELLEREVKRLDELVQTFLRLARGFDLHEEPTDLNALVREVVEFGESETKRARVAARLSLDSELPSVRIDRGLFRQALVNLVVNARQAMPEGGELIVRTAIRDRQVIVEVTDTGVGMPPDVLARCFDAYFSTKRGGTGLGLPTTRRIVEEHGGSVEVWSEPGRGTRFTISLPLERKEAGSRRDPA